LKTPRRASIRTVSLLLGIRTQQSISQSNREPSSSSSPSSSSLPPSISDTCAPTLKSRCIYRALRHNSRLITMFSIFIFLLRGRVTCTRCVKESAFFNAESCLDDRNSFARKYNFLFSAAVCAIGQGKKRSAAIGCWGSFFCKGFSVHVLVRRGPGKLILFYVCSFSLGMLHLLNL
jgi:hypothetical protein